MDCELKNRLYTLSRQSRLKDIIELTESIVMHQPQDLAVRYCAGMAKAYTGDFVGGLDHLNGILQMYESLQLFKEPDFETKRFVGHCALQLSVLSEFYTAFKLDKALASKYSNKAAVTARAIAHDVEDLELRRQAESILRRHLVWCIKNENGCVEGGIYAVPPSPFVLQIEPTNHCNIRCLMCPHRKVNRKKGFLEESLLDKILAGWSGKSVEITLEHLVLEKVVVRNWKVPGVVKLYYMGEPLLHPKLNILISKIRNCGVFAGIQTNGILFRDPELRKDILHARPSGIWFSIDGMSSQTYEAVRKGSSWPQLCEAIQALYRDRKEMGLEQEVKFGITSIVPENNSLDNKKTSDFLEPILSLVDYTGFTTLDRRMGGEFYDSNGKIFSFQNTVIPVCASAIKEHPLCPESLEKLNVLWNGQVTPCGYDINGEMELGDANGETIDAIWNSEKTRDLHSALLNHRFDNLALCQFCKGKFA